MSNWEPISTAPKNGVPILARSSHYALPFVVFWSAKCIEEGPMPALPEGSIIECSWLLSNSEYCDEILYSPEEWMPIQKEGGKS